jgi:tetratricopeptide (TPR) repeat protein
MSQSQLSAALAAADDASATAEERAEMLMEIAMGLQQRPKSVQQLHDAIALYERALELAPAAAALLRARIGARLGTAWQALPDDDGSSLRSALQRLLDALPMLQAGGRAEEAAEVELNVGLVLQSLAGAGRARLTDAIAAYQRALRTFDREHHPQEYALLHNNLAIAYLAIPAADERARMREALAVQSFEEVLKVVNLVDHPAEYAMAQNNLGNALQAVASGHPVENRLRALTAYDEALRVRNPRDMPLEYANTIANKAQLLLALPAEALGDVDPLNAGLALLDEAAGLYERYGDTAKAALVGEAAADVRTQLDARRRQAS